jgi:hypothetical protein
MAVGPGIVLHPCCFELRDKHFSGRIRDYHFCFDTYPYSRAFGDWYLLLDRLPLSFAVAFRLVLRDRSEREDVPRYWNSILSCCQRADAFIDLSFLMS